MNDEQRQPTAAAPEEGVDRGVQALVRALKILFFALRIVLVLTVVYVLFSGVFYVEPHEEAMLFRFGKLVKKGDSEILRPGNWYWAWPYPIDEVKTVPAQRSVTLTSTQFWPVQNPNILPEQQVAPTVLKPGEGGYLLTADANIMHMVWSVTYRVTNAKNYYLDFYQEPETGPAQEPDPSRKYNVETTIQNVLDQSVLATVARWPVEDVLVLTRRGGNRERESLGRAVQARLGDHVDELELGVEIQAVSLVEVQPPQATRDAFREVVDAAQQYQIQIDNAQAYAERVTTEAEGSKAQIVAEASQYRDRIVKTVQADKKYFEKILEEYRKTPEMLLALYTDVLRDVLDRAESKYVVHTRKDGRQEVRMQLGPEPEKRRTREPGEGME